MQIPFVRPLALLLSLALLTLGARFVWLWYDGILVLGPDGVWHASRGPIWQLLLGVSLLSLSFIGRPLFLLFLPSRSPLPSERVGRGRLVMAPDGTRLSVQSLGPQSGPVVVLTHGWGLAAPAWSPIRNRLAANFRVLCWDLPGLGRSSQPSDGTYTLDRFAQALGSILEDHNADKVVLVGHSIGGMTSETFWRACPEAVRARVTGVVLVHTTHTNPLATMWLSGLWVALQKPMIEPIQRLTILLSPVIWLMNWQSYYGGSLHFATWLTSFGRHATREAVDLAARLAAQASPAVQAKGNLAMLHWRVTEDLARVAVPTLILAGSSDIITLPSASEEIAARIPGSTLRLFDHVGHLGYLELDEAYAKAIEGFVSDVAAPGPLGRPANVASA